MPRPAPRRRYRRNDTSRTHGPRRFRLKADGHGRCACRAWRHNVAGLSTTALSLGVGYDAKAGQASITAAYAGAPDIAFETRALVPGKVIYQGGVGLNCAASKTLDIAVRYGAEIRTGFDLIASVQARWKF